MIEKITSDKYLYQGRIVSLEFLQARKAQLEEMITANQTQIDSIELIDCENLEGKMKEAAEFYNEKSDKSKQLLIDLNEILNIQLKEIII